MRTSITTTCPITDAEFEQFLETCSSLNDDGAAHDVSHVRRVVGNARTLMTKEGADPLVVVPAAWLHDCVVVPKNSSQRAEASAMAAERAVEFLTFAGYPGQTLDGIHHAISAHSFSAGIPPRTLEAKVVQDADRIDALGAIGIARCFAIGGALKRPLYCDDDPLCEERPPDDRRYTVDHFYAKLLTLEGTMQTRAGRDEAARRTEHMKAFLVQLKQDILGLSEG